MKNLEQWIAGLAQPSVVESDETVLIAAGQMTDGAVWVEQGAVEILRGVGEAHGWVCHIAQAPCLVGLAELLGDAPEHVESARALGRVRVKRVEKAPIRHVLLSDAQALREATVALTERLLTSARAGMLPGTEAEARLAWLFTAYGAAAGIHEGHTLRLPIRRTQAQLARAIGGSERSVNRVITRWKSERLLDKVFGEHVIYQPEELARRAIGMHQETSADALGTAPPVGEAVSTDAQDSGVSARIA